MQDDALSDGAEDDLSPEDHGMCTLLQVFHVLKSPQTSSSMVGNKFEP